VKLGRIWLLPSDSDAKLARDHWVGTLCAIGAALGFSVKAILARMAYREAAVQHDSLDALTLVTLRMLFSAPLFLLMAWVGSKKAAHRSLTLTDWRGLGLAAFLGYYLASFLDFWGLEFITASLERIVLFTYPGFVLLLNWLLFGQKITWRHAAALALAFAGVAVAFSGESDATPDRSMLLKGTSLVLLASAAYAGYMVTTGRLVGGIGSIRITGIVISLSASFIITHFALTRPFSVLKQSANVYGIVALLAILSSVLPIFLTAEAVKRIGSSRVSIIGFVGPVFTMWLGSVLLQEWITPLQWIGTSMVLIGVGLVSSKALSKESVKPTLS
jgi:drug/metabolite transporter (DMT)-like permease